MKPHLLLAGLLALLLTACGKSEPIRIGFIGGLSDRTNDTGEAARNALMLAIEQRNAAGGIDGRPLEMLVADDGQEASLARKAMSALIAGQPAAIVGPYTSAVAEAILPQADQAGIVLLSPVITSMQFVGKDDMLIRLNRSTRDNAGDYAQQLIGRGISRLAVALDVRNRAFSASWLDELRASYPALGGEILTVVEFHSAASTSFSDIADQLLDAAPGGLLFIANAVDVARLAQQVRKRSADVPLAADIPVLVVHGTADEVTPLSESERLVASAPALASLKTVEGAGHLFPATHPGETSWFIEDYLDWD